MSSTGSVPPPLPPTAHPPQPRPMTAPPAVVQVVSKRSGFGAAVGFVVGLLVFGLVFMFGLVFGVFGTVAANSVTTPLVEAPYRDGSGDRIAIIPVYGMIDGRQSAFVQGAISHVMSDPSIAAVVLRVDSPGGDVTSSDQIWYEVERLKMSGVPVVASYGGIAASGGYYVSCGADHIVAERTCITGSIGVIAQAFTLGDLMDKIGVEPVTLVATGSPQKAVGNDTFRKWDERDREQMRAMLDAAYDIFNERVTAGRRHVIKSQARIDELANGSVYTADQALDGGLIDSIGYLDDAIAEAERQAGLISGWSSVFMIIEPPKLFDGIPGLDVRSGHRPAEIFDPETIRRVANDLTSPRLMYLMW